MLVNLFDCPQCTCVVRSKVDTESLQGKCLKCGFAFDVIQACASGLYGKYISKERLLQSNWHLQGIVALQFIIKSVASVSGIVRKVHTCLMKSGESGLCRN